MISSRFIKSVSLKHLPHVGALVRDTDFADLCLEDVRQSKPVLEAFLELLRGQEVNLDCKVEDLEDFDPSYYSGFAGLTLDFIRQSQDLFYAFIDCMIASQK